MTVQKVGQFPVSYQVLDPARGVGMYSVSAGFMLAQEATSPVLAYLDVISASGDVLARTLRYVDMGKHVDLNVQCVVANEEGATAHMFIQPVPIAWPHRDLMDYAQHLGLYRPGKDRPELEYPDYEEGWYEE